MNPPIHVQQSARVLLKHAEAQIEFLKKEIAELEKKHAELKLDEQMKAVLAWDKKRTEPTSVN